MVAYNQNLGMNPVKSLKDSPYSANFLWYPIASGYGSNIFVGTPVTITAGFVTVGVSGSAIIGAARSFKDFTTGGTGIVAPSANQGVIPTTIQQYWAASTTKPTGVQTYVAVQVDTGTLYDMQADSSLANGFLQTNLIANFNFSTTAGFQVGSGNTSTGYSTTRLFNASGTNMQLINLAPNNGNAWGTALNNGLFVVNSSLIF